MGEVRVAGTVRVRRVEVEGTLTTHARLRSIRALERMSATETLARQRMRAIKLSVHKFSAS